MKIVQMIEELRKELIEQGTSKGLQDPEVIRLSQKLDEFINTYYRAEDELCVQVELFQKDE